MGKYFPTIILCDSAYWFSNIMVCMIMKYELSSCKLVMPLANLWPKTHLVENSCYNGTQGKLIDWKVHCLLAGPDLWKRMLLNCSITMVFICPLLSWYKISSPFRENDNIIVLLPFPFHIFAPMANLWFIYL